MFTTLRMRLLLGLYVFLILCIPVGAYLVSQQQTIKSRASEASPSASLKSSPKPITSPAKELLSALESSDFLPSPAPEANTSPTIATSFGPTLSLKVSLEARPADNQATKLFVGIVEGSLSTNPKFLLNFSVKLPSDGTYTNLSLAGLTTGTKYTALIKGAAQIASSVEFTMSPNVTNLNEGLAINLKTGDLNEDNTINSADYSIVKALLGSSKSSSNWNDNVDLNKDGVINTVDLLIVSKNLGQTGASGIWTSPLNKNATPSGSLTQEATGSTSGYWIWIPK